MRTATMRVAAAVAIVLAVGCGEPANGQADAKPGQPKAMTKLSTFDHAEFCDIGVGADGTLHAVFTDQPQYTNPRYVYYRASTDGGKTWSDAKNLSDDESGHGASYAHVIADGKGRVYVIWKYVRKDELLDGPGGGASGIITYRVLEGGNWSKRVAISDKTIPTYSWFATLDPAGAVNVVYSQMTKDAVENMPNGYWYYANLVRQVVLDGPNVGQPKDITTPKPLLTKAQQEEMKKAGKYPKYEDTVPTKDGLINLRGFIGPDGVLKFVGENNGITDGPSAQQTGKRIMLWDGTKLTPIYAFEKYQTYNTFNNPPMLVPGTDGKLHLIRAPEKSETKCVRDYVIDGDQLGDPVDIVAPQKPTGNLGSWQVTMLPGNRIAVTAAVSEKGGYQMDDLELYISIRDEKGNWSKPVSVTDNAARQSFSHKATSAASSIDLGKTYLTAFASICMDKDGKPCVLMVNKESSLIGVTTPVGSGAGTVVGALSTGRVDSPMVFFLRMP
jgi:hypothetical protein